MSDTMDLTGLTNTQRNALQAAKGDPLKVPDDVAQSVGLDTTPQAPPPRPTLGAFAPPSSGGLAINDAGDVLAFDGQKWGPAKVAANANGERRAFDGQAWRPVGTKLYSPNPNAPTTYGPGGAPDATPSTMPAARVIGQGAQGVNDAIANTAGWPVDEVARGLRGIGVPATDPVGGSASLKRGIDYLATLPGRASDALSFGSLAPFTESRTSRFEPEGDAEKYARATGEGVGSALGFALPAGAISKLPQAAGTLWGSVAGGLAAAPKMQVAANVAGNVATQATDNPYAGLATALALPVITKGAQRSFSAAPATTTQETERRALLDFGRSIGAPQTAGKILDSKKLQTVESVLDKNPVPFVGGLTSATEAAGRNAWQKAILEKAGIQGETAATPNVTERATARIGQQFNDLTKGSTINVTPKFGQDLDAIKSEYGDRLFEDVQPGLMRRINELNQAPAALSQSGNPSVTLDGKTYQNIRSDLSRIAGTATKGADRRAAGAMVKALDDMAEKSLPADVMGDWKTARQQWRNLLAIRGAVKGSNNAETAVGNIPTAAFGRKASGNPDLERLGQYGNAFVGDKIPNSGTASRHAAGALAMGIPAAIASGHLPLNMATGAAAAATAVPYGFDFLMNNNVAPVARALLLSRYRNPSASIASRPLFGALAGEHFIQAPERRY